MKKILTIAGSDSGAGAGIQADLKTFSALGVYGTSAITALTAQNTIDVQGIYPVPTSFISLQIDSVMQDIGADAWKTGMLATTEIIETVSKKVNQYQVKLLIVDPVIVAKGNKRLLENSAENAYIKKLIPLSYVVTPNLHEASVLTNMSILTVDDMKKAATKIHAMGTKYVVVKGGHLKDPKNAVDLLFDGKNFHTFSAPRISTKNTHGTGCTFASAIAAYLVQGKSIHDAVSEAKSYVTHAIKKGNKLQIGHGHGPLGHF